MTAKELESLLESLGMGQGIRRGNNLMFLCPNHSERRPSWGISKTPPHVHGCFACGFSGTLRTLLIDKFNWSLARIREELGEETRGSKELSWDEEESLPVKFKPPEPIDPRNLWPFLMTPKGFSYLRDRGILKETIKKAGLLFDEKKKRVLFPWYWNNKLVGATGRTILKSEEKAGRKIIAYFGLKKGRVLYVPSRRLKKDEQVILVEGECFDSVTEVLTESGWVKLSNKRELQGKKVAQWNKGVVEWVYPISYIENSFDGSLLHFCHPQIDLVVTPGHKMIFLDKENTVCATKAENWVSGSFKIPKTGLCYGQGVGLSNSELRFCVAVSADAKIDFRKNGDRYIHFGLKKARKVERLKELLFQLKISYTYNLSKDGKGYHYFSMTIPIWVPGRKFPWNWISELSLEQRKVILNEIPFWNGNLVPNRKQWEYSSKYFHNASWVQTLAHTTGVCATIIPRKNSIGEWFRVSLLLSKTSCSYQRKPFLTLKGLYKVYCLEVPSGALLVRRDDKIAVCGNCDALKVFQAGFKNVAALGHGRFSDQVKSLLVNLPAKQVVLFFDFDKKGIELTREVAGKLQNYFPVYSVGYNKFFKMKGLPKVKLDPGGFDSGAIRILLSLVTRSVSWPKF